MRGTGSPGEPGGGPGLYAALEVQEAVVAADT